MKEQAIIMPGLGKGELLSRLATRDWKRKYNITPYIHRLDWGRHTNIDRQRESVRVQMQRLRKQGQKVYLIG